MSSPKLHELLAVESNLKTQADATRTDLINTFAKKTHHFTKKVVTFSPVEEGQPPVTEEQLELQTTVPRELEWISGKLAAAIDVSYRVAEGNTAARADVVLSNGTIILTAVPATALLELEKRVGEVMALVKVIPTLDPAKGFKPAEDIGDDVFVAREDNKTRTRKTQRVIQLAPATDKHPAQVQLVSVDEKAGTVQTQEWSGLITTKDKGDMLDRVEDLKRAVKAALSRANDTPVLNEVAIGKKLLSYVFGS